MISFYIRNTKISIYFFFPAVLTLFLLLDPSQAAMLSVLAGFLHELGHLTVMLLLGIYPDEISFELSGIRLRKNLACLPRFWEAVMLLAGSGTNFLFFLLELLRMKGNFLSLFGMIHLSLGILNLLPFSSLDGGKLLSLFLNSVFSAQIAEKLLFVLQVLLILFMTAFCIFCFLQKQGNFTLLILCGYCIVSLCTEFTDGSSK